MDHHDYYQLPQDLVASKKDAEKRSSGDQSASLGEMLLGQNVKTSHIPNLSKKIPQVTETVQMDEHVQFDTKKDRSLQHAAQNEMLVAKKILQKVRVTNQEVEKLKKNAKTIQDRHQKLIDDLSESFGQVSTLKKESNSSMDLLKDLLDESKRVLDRSKDWESEHRILVGKVEKSLRQLLKIEAEVRGQIDKDHDRDLSQRKLQSELFEIQNSMHLALSSMDTLKKETGNLFYEVSARWQDLNQSQKNAETVIVDAKKVMSNLEVLSNKISKEHNFFTKDYQEKRAALAVVEQKVNLSWVDVHNQTEEVLNLQTQAKEFMGLAHQTEKLAESLLVSSQEAVLKCRDIAESISQDKDIFQSSRNEIAQITQESTDRLLQIQQLQAQAQENTLHIDRCFHALSQQVMSDQQKNQSLLSHSEENLQSTSVLNNRADQILESIQLQKEETEKTYKKCGHALALTNKAYQEVLKILSDIQLQKEDIRSQKEGIDKKVESSEKILNECKNIYDKNIFVQQNTSNLLREMLQAKEETQESIDKIYSQYQEYQKLNDVFFTEANDLRQSAKEAKELYQQANAFYENGVGQAKKLQEEIQSQKEEIQSQKEEIQSQKEEIQIQKEGVDQKVESSEKILNECKSIYDKNIFVQQNTSHLLREMLQAKEETQESIGKIHSQYQEHQKLNDVFVLEANDLRQSAKEAKELYQQANDFYENGVGQAKKLLLLVEENRISYADEIEQLHQLMRENRQLSAQVTDIAQKEEVKLVQIEKAVLQNEMLRKEVIVLKNKNDHYLDQYENVLLQFRAVDGDVKAVLSSITDLKQQTQHTFLEHLELNEQLKSFVEKTMDGFLADKEDVLEKVSQFKIEKEFLVEKIEKNALSFIENESKIESLYSLIHDEVDVSRLMFERISLIENKIEERLDESHQNKEKMQSFLDEFRVLYDKNSQLHESQKIDLNAVQDQIQIIRSIGAEVNAHRDQLKLHQVEMHQLFEQSHFSCEKNQKISDKTEAAYEKIATILTHANEISFDIKTKKIEFDDAIRANQAYKVFFEKSIEKTENIALSLDQKYEKLTGDLEEKTGEVVFYFQKKMNDIEDALQKFSDEKIVFNQMLVEKTEKFGIVDDLYKKAIDSYERNVLVKKEIELLLKSAQEFKDEMASLKSIADQLKELGFLLNQSKAREAQLQEREAHAIAREEQARAREEQYQQELKQAATDLEQMTLKMQELAKQHKEGMALLKDAQLLNRESRIAQKEMGSELKLLQQQFEQLKQAEQFKKEDQSSQLEKNQALIAMQTEHHQVLRQLQSEAVKQAKTIQSMTKIIAHLQAAAEKEEKPRHGSTSFNSLAAESSQVYADTFPSIDSEENLLKGLDEKLNRPKSFKLDAEKKKSIKNFLFSLLCLGLLSGYSIGYHLEFSPAFMGEVSQAHAVKRPASLLQWGEPLKASHAFEKASILKSGGIVLTGKEREPVLAAADGVVIFSSKSHRESGHLVVIEHAPEVMSIYGRAQSPFVLVGDFVKKGEPILLLSEEGQLYFELRGHQEKQPTESSI